MTETHVCRGENRQFNARVRPSGRRRYTVGRDRPTFEAAMRDLFKMFRRDIHKRGDVIMTADYYEPVRIVEIVKL